MARTRTSYDNVMPSMKNILQYVDVCGDWMTVRSLATIFGRTEDSVAKMCKRLHRNGILDKQASPNNNVHGASEYRASEEGLDVFRRFVDG